MNDTSADTPNVQFDNPHANTEAAATLLESAKAQHVLDGLGLLALAVGTALILSVPEAVIVTASLTALTLTARRLRAHLRQPRTGTNTKRGTPQSVGSSESSNS